MLQICSTQGVGDPPFQWLSKQTVPGDFARINTIRHPMFIFGPRGGAFDLVAALCVHEICPALPVATEGAMEKVWFNLRQTDHPPPAVEIMGRGEDTTPIYLGHSISDLQHIDFVLNWGAIGGEEPGVSNDESLSWSTVGRYRLFSSYCVTVEIYLNFFGYFCHPLTAASPILRN